jgi:hypothetical protein
MICPKEAEHKGRFFGALALRTDPARSCENAGAKILVLHD